MKKLILILIAVYLPMANAELTVSVASRHFGNSDYNYNETNPGLINYWYSKNYYTFVGAYKNSHSENSVIAGIGHEWNNLCFEYGYVSGYENTNLAAQFCYRFNIYNQKFKINAIPAKQFGVAESDIISLQWSMPW